MQYRRFGKLDWKVSALGFGAMRLPTTGTEQPAVDEPEAIRMIRYAIDHGVNYLDTAYPYHGGHSERIVGRALKDGYRQKMKLTTKLPARQVESASDFDRFFEEQLQRLDTKLDFYLLHGLNRNSWAKVRDLGILNWAEKQIADGRFDHLGFSFHDDFDAFKNIVDGYDNWTLCQIQYNYMDVDFQAGRRGLEYAASKDLAVVIMEPLRGGRLARKPPEKVAEVWASADQQRSPAEWGLLWVWNQPEVSVVLSGMSAMEQVAENVAVAGRSGPGTLTTDEQALYQGVIDAYEVSNPIPCTGCEYCMPCPNGVEIPTIFQIYNDASVWDDFRTGRGRYRGPTGLREEQRADQCIECGECSDVCPQEIPVAEWLQKVHEILGPRP